MVRITKVNIAAAIAEREILLRNNEPVPEVVEELANLDPDLISTELPADAVKPTSGTTFRAHMDDILRSGWKRESEWHNYGGPSGVMDVYRPAGALSTFGNTGYSRRTDLEPAWPLLLWIVDKDHLARAAKDIHETSLIQEQGIEPKPHKG